MGTIIEETLFLPERWGLSKEAIGGLGDGLENVWGRYRGCFKTKTRDSAKHAWTYLRGPLEMKTGRNYANIARRVSEPMEDGQNLQQFMSDSPWEAQAVIRKVQEEIASTPSLQAGGILLLDESADEKAGPKSAGAGRQHNGRLGKIEMSQVGVFLAFYVERVWTWVDGELFLPKHWFTPEMAKERKRMGIPEERQFASKENRRFIPYRRLGVIGTFSVTGVVITREILKVESSKFGIMMSALGVGMLGGAIISGWLGRRFTYVQLGVGSVILMALGMMAFPWSPNLAMACLFAGLIGLGMIIVQGNG